MLAARQKHLFSTEQNVLLALQNLSGTLKVNFANVGQLMN